MRRPLVIAALLAAAMPVAVWAQAPSPDETGADFFKESILSDTKTSSAVKSLLRRRGGFVDPASVYGDLTGDGKADAVVRVDSGGAAGAVAVYVFTAQGSSSGDLRIAYRNQRLNRVTTRIERGSLLIRQPVWKRGDDVCCPTVLRQQDYVWNARLGTLRANGPTQEFPVE